MIRRAAAVLILSAVADAPARSSPARRAAARRGAREAARDRRIRVGPRRQVAAGVPRQRARLAAEHARRVLRGAVAGTGGAEAARRPAAEVEPDVRQVLAA